MHREMLQVGGCLYPDKHQVSVVIFVRSALPLVCNGLHITQQCQISQQVRVLGAIVRPGACKLDAMQVLLPALREEIL